MASELDLAVVVEVIASVVVVVAVVVFGCGVVLIFCCIQVKIYNTKYVCNSFSCFYASEKALKNKPKKTGNLIIHKVNF